MMLLQLSSCSIHQTQMEFLRAQASDTHYRLNIAMQAYHLRDQLQLWRPTSLSFTCRRSTTGRGTTIALSAHYYATTPSSNRKMLWPTPSVQYPETRVILGSHGCRYRKHIQQMPKVRTEISDIIQKSKSLFLKAARPVEFIWMDIFDASSKTAQHNHYILIVTDGFLKLNCASPTFEPTSTFILDLSFENCLITYGIAMSLIISNGAQFIYCIGIHLTWCQTFHHYDSPSSN